MEKDFKGLEVHSTMYMVFYLKKQKPKTKVFGVRNKHHDLPIGEIKWNGHWRQYCFYSLGNIVLSDGCMEDIQGFIRGLMEEWKDARRQKNIQVS